MDENKVKEQYNLMSHFYDVLYSAKDSREFEKEFINEYEELLNVLPENAKVLDSSCGNGVQAAVLKRKGIDVMATDISEEMVKLTKEYAKKNDLVFPTKQLSWQQLPNNFGDEFDLVFCYGNSISHSLGQDEMIANIESLYKVTKKGGKIIIDTRNWEKVLKENIRFRI